MLAEICTFIVAIGLWLIPWALIEYGIKIIGYPSIPDTVVTMYMVLVWVGVVLYISSEQRRAHRFVSMLKRIWVLLLALPPLIMAHLAVHGGAATLSALIIPPMLIGNFVSGEVATIQPPPERTVVHSASPLDFVGIDNPLSDQDPKTLADDDPLIKYGETLYQQNCRWCHGKEANGKGEFAQGFLPRPANFKDPGTIAQLKQSYLLWRITEGGWEEPFLSAMPRWHEDIDDDEKWAIILYEYHHAGVSPRGAAE
ncbi:MAG: cytochrome c [Dehalococcoidia bacterium]